MYTYQIFHAISIFLRLRKLNKHYINQYCVFRIQSTCQSPLEVHQSVLLVRQNLPSCRQKPLTKKRSKCRDTDARDPYSFVRLSSASVGVVRSWICAWSVNIYASLAVAVKANAGMAIHFIQTALVGLVLKGCLLTVFPPTRCVCPQTCAFCCWASYLASPSRTGLVSTCFGRWPGPSMFRHQYPLTSGIFSRMCGRPRDILPLPSSAPVEQAITVARSVVECRTRNQVSPGSNPPLLPFRVLGILVLSIDAPVDSGI